MNNLNNDDSKITQPNNLNIELMEHQKTVIKAMSDFEVNGYIDIHNFKCFSNKPQNIRIESSIGILGDKVGSGKSLMIIGLILLNNKIVYRPEYYESSKYINIKSKDEKDKNINSNLIIVPHKIINQWYKYFDYAPELKIFVYDSSTKDELLKLENLSNYDIVLVPCTKTEHLYNSTQDLRWSRIIIDECDTIRLPKNIEFNSKFIWLITGTPSGIVYNNRPYLNNMFKKNKDWIVDYITVKNNNNYINESIKLPVPLRISIKCFTPPELKIKEFMPKNIIDMINAGNTDEAIKLLNCNEDTNDNILKILTRNIIEAIKNKNIELEAENNKKYHGLAKDEQIKKINNLKKIVDRLNERYNSIKKKIQELNDEYCPICLDNFNRPVILSCCKNIYCFECLTVAAAQNNACPNCKSTIDKKNLHIVNNKKSKNDNNKKTKKDTELKNKIDVLCDILKSKPNGKIMIFANYAGTFLKIEKVLIEQNISYAILKGNSTSVNNYISQFDEGKIKIIMLNAQHFGAGMNLQMATDIIMYHRFTKEMEEQIIGRAQRIGRNNQLNIYYLIHDNENNSLENNDKYEDIGYEQYIEKLEKI